MSIQLVLASSGVIVIIAGLILYRTLAKKNPKYAYLTYACWGIGLIVFGLFATLWMREVYKDDDAKLATLSIVCIVIALGASLAYLPCKRAPKWVNSILVAILFIALIAFLICMVMLSQKAIANGGVPASSSESLPA